MLTAAAHYFCLYFIWEKVANPDSTRVGTGAARHRHLFNTPIDRNPYILNTASGQIIKLYPVSKLIPPKRTWNGTFRHRRLNLYVYILYRQLLFCRTARNNVFRLTARARKRISLILLYECLNHDPFVLYVIFSL